MSALVSRPQEEPMTGNHPLLRALSMQVERVPHILVGLSESELRQSVVRSGWSPLGMSVHVREGVRFFPDEIMAGNAPSYSVPGDFEVDPGLNGTEVLERFERVATSALEGCCAIFQNRARKQSRRAATLSGFRGRRARLIWLHSTMLSLTAAATVSSFRTGRCGRAHRRRRWEQRSPRSGIGR